MDSKKMIREKQVNNIKKLKLILATLEELDEVSKIEVINILRLEIHKYSPFKNEPVDCIQWIDANKIKANDYNPNIVAPPEMELLEHSINSDGYTQPIVAWENDGIYEVVDGFHRNRIGKENKQINARIKGYLPITIINKKREDRGDRIGATIRHNRARGKHIIEGMSEIVLELKRRNWSDKKISKELGMDKDEVLRLTQITGLAEMFQDKEFSEAWEADISIINEDDNLDINEENEKD